MARPDITARQRAMRALAKQYPDTFAKLYAAERAKLGLDDTPSDDRPRPKPRQCRAMVGSM